MDTKTADRMLYRPFELLEADSDLANHYSFERIAQFRAELRQVIKVAYVQGRESAKREIAS